MTINEVSRAFDCAASNYERVAKIQIEIGQRLIERLDYFKFQPHNILDLGCGPGILTQQLKNRYPKAKVIALDLSHAMLLQAQSKQTWRKKWSSLMADATRLPFKSNSFDLVFSNQMIHWVDSIGGLFKEINRVIRAEGVFLFSTLGPDTFKELKQSWSHSAYSHINEFSDMHDIGDCLRQHSFNDPVVDMESIELLYREADKIIGDLRAQGVKNVNKNRNKGLTGRQQWHQFIDNMEQSRNGSGLIPLSYEVIYGQSWGKVLPRSGDEVKVSVSDIPVKSNFS